MGAGMTWGPYVTLEPKRSPEEEERHAEEQRARRHLRRLGWILAIAFVALGLRNCAAMGDRVSDCTAIAASYRQGD